MRRLSIILSAIYAIVRIALEAAGGEAAVPIVDVAFLISILYALTRDVEENITELGVHGLFNVLVVSWVAAIPQTVVALYFASVGKYEAAFYDSMVSTLVDAFLVTALVRWSYLDAIRRDWIFIVLWVAATLAYGALIDLPLPGWHHAWFAIGAVILPLAFARGLVSKIRLDMYNAVNLVVNALILGWIAWDIGQALVSWHIYSEAALGALAAVIATIPDLMTALLIRAVVGRRIAEMAASEDAIRTMFAAAIHDQISVPALIVLVAPQAVSVFPHWLNIVVSILKFTLLDRRAFLIGLAASIYIIASLMLGV
ncbi:MAG: hypothetical protein ACP5H5_03730 [Pyrobaculum sp.]